MMTPGKLCKCGCGQEIIIKRNHKWRGIPDFIHGHSSRINNPMSGKHPSEETRHKLRTAKIGWISPMKGRKSSEETKRKLSEALKKRWENPEYRDFQSKVHKGRTISEEQRERISKANSGRVKSAETIRKISEGHKGKHLSKEHREKLSRIGKGRKFADTHRERISRAQSRNWKNGEFARKMGIAWAVKPNKPEAILLNLLNGLYPSQWKYTGDFSFTINGKCPDFVNCNGQKKIIELFGDYWHRGDNPKDRAELFRPFGYETLVIWERELSDMDSLFRKLDAFMVA